MASGTETQHQPTRLKRRPHCVKVIAKKEGRGRAGTGGTGGNPHHVPSCCLLPLTPLPSLFCGQLGIFHTQAKKPPSAHFISQHLLRTRPATGDGCPWLGDTGSFGRGVGWVRAPGQDPIPPPPPGGPLWAHARTDVPETLASKQHRCPPVWFSFEVGGLSPNLL